MNRLGLRVTDCTGVDIGNSDLDYAEQGWTNTPDTADGHNAPLPGYPAGTWPTCLPVLPTPRVEALKDVAAMLVIGALGFATGAVLL